MTTCDDLAYLFIYMDYAKHACVCVCVFVSTIQHAFMRVSHYYVFYHYLWLSCMYARRICRWCKPITSYDFFSQIHSIRWWRSTVANLDESLKLSLSECTMAIVLANTSWRMDTIAARGSYILSRRHYLWHTRCWFSRFACSRESRQLAKMYLSRQLSWNHLTGIYNSALASSMTNRFVQFFFEFSRFTARENYHFYLLLPVSTMLAFGDWIPKRWPVDGINLGNFTIRRKNK